MNDPFISICIPAYKHPEYLRRLLDSISIQTFRDFELIITDDSPDNSVGEMVSIYAEALPILYFKNLSSLGTPANWNQSIRNANGQWIKLMHDDDWFSAETSLQEYVSCIMANPPAKFIFSAFRNIDIGIVHAGPNTPKLKYDSGTIVRPGQFRMNQLRKSPVTLLSKNIIGPPSVVIHKNDRKHFYDTQLKWLVDMDFYIRFLAEQNPVYIDKPLINIGINPLQVTNSSSLVREVEIPEHFRIMEKTGTNQLRNLLVYDAWWRLLRNLMITDVSEIAGAGYKGNVPGALRGIVSMQAFIPYKLLKFGPVSKIFMFMTYLFSKIRNNFE